MSNGLGGRYIERGSKGKWDCYKKRGKLSFTWGEVGDKDLKPFSKKKIEVGEGGIK